MDLLIYIDRALDWLGFEKSIDEIKPDPEAKPLPKDGSPTDSFSIPPMKTKEDEPVREPTHPLFEPFDLLLAITFYRTLKVDEMKKIIIDNYVSKKLPISESESLREFGRMNTHFSETAILKIYAEAIGLICRRPPSGAGAPIPRRPT